MSDGFEKIKELGSQKVYEQTHISRKNIDDLLAKNFKAMHSVQVAGFISILEREYAIDLSEFKEEADAYYQAQRQSEENIETIAPPPKEEGSKKWLIVGAIAVLLLAVMMMPGGKDNKKATEPVVFVPDVNSAGDVKPAAPEAIEENLSLEVSQPEVPAQPVLPERIVIKPSTELWMGFIDLSDHKKSQKLTTEAVELDATKDWLIVFGHGFLSFEIGDEVQKFSNRGRLLFLYEDGVLKEITNEEFKLRNRGRTW